MPYIRLRLDTDTHSQFASLMAQLQQRWPDEFFSQLDPRAGLGCHPLHVTFVGGLGQYSDAQVQRAIEEGIRRINTRIKISLSKWHLSGVGGLKLQVDAVGPAFKQLQTVLAEALPKGKIWRSLPGTTCGYHITCGTFVGSASRRRAFLEQLQQQYAAHGEVVCSTIEFENDKLTPNPPILELVGRTNPPMQELSSAFLDEAWAAAYSLARDQGEVHQVVGEVSMRLSGPKLVAWLSRSDNKLYTLLHQLAWHQQLDGNGQILLALGARSQLKNYRGETPAAVQARRIEEARQQSVRMEVDAMVAQVHELALQLSGQAIRLRCDCEKSGFCSLRPCDRSAVTKLLRPLHDVLKSAYEAAPEHVIEWLGSGSDAYRSGLGRLGSKRLRWVSKLNNLHASVVRGGQSGKAVMACIKQRKVIQGSFAAVDQRIAQHLNHTATSSALLCYATSPTKAWVTLHLDPRGLLEEGLQPDDRWYFHISLAKLEIRQASKGVTDGKTNKGEVGKGNGKGKSKGKVAKV